MAKDKTDKPAASRRGKSAWVAKTLYGDPKVVSGPTSKGIGRAAAVHNAQHNLGLDTKPGPPRQGKTGRKTGGGF